MALIAVRHSPAGFPVILHVDDEINPGAVATELNKLYVENNDVTLYRVAETPVGFILTKFTPRQSSIVREERVTHIEFD